MKAINKKTIILLLSIIFTFSFCLVGCGSSAMDLPVDMNDSVIENEKYEPGFSENTKDEYLENQDNPIDSSVENNEKLVYRCSMEIETTNYEETVNIIKNQIAKFNGILEYENENDSSYDWYYSEYEKTSGTLSTEIRVRIPSKDYNNFLNSIEGQGKIKNKVVDVQNISKKYYETEAVIESLKIQEERLLNMMNKAQTIEEMIQVEKRLTEVQIDLNTYNTLISTMDTDVAYSTITLRIQEVMEYTPDQETIKTNKFSDRLKNTIIDSWRFFLQALEDLLFLVIRLIPILVIIGAIGIPIACVVHSKKKSKNKKVKSSDDKNKQNNT